MTNTKAIIMLFALSTILITGGLTIAPAAYSTGNNHDDSHDDSHGGCNDDSHDDSGDCVPDPCDCKKPDTLKVTYTGPVEIVVDENGDPILDENGDTMEQPVTIKIFKKTKKMDPDDQLGNDITDVHNNEIVMISASMFGKDKLNSNTVFQIINSTDGSEIDIVEIHTSCSQPLHEGLVKDGQNGKVSLTVESGERDGNSSIPPSDPLTCGIEPEEPKTASITIKKAITNDNGGLAVPEDFEVTLTPTAGTPVSQIFVKILDDPTMGIATFVDIPVDDYVLTEVYIGAIQSPTYNTVLIAGDTTCPSMENELFTMKEGKDITCIIYNDDDFVEGANGGDGTVVYTNSLQITEFTGVHPNSAVTGPQGTGFCSTEADTAPIVPCVKKIGSQEYRILESSVNLDDKTLVLSNVVASNGGANLCFTGGIVEDITILTAGDVTNMAYVVFCQDIADIVLVDGALARAYYDILYGFIPTNL